MVEPTDEDIDQALERGRRAHATEPRAKAARYDRRARQIVVDLTNGCTFAFPPGLAQGLEAATPEDVAAVEVLGAGCGLHWEALDVDLSVTGLLAGLFGTAAYIAAQLARRAGQTSSPAKSAAARINGAKGGRPRKAVRA